ncbi:MAG: TIGR00374 family protein, partial [[Mycobacterium] stephanolepidis]
MVPVPDDRDPLDGGCTPPEGSGPASCPDDPEADTAPQPVIKQRG